MATRSVKVGSTLALAAAVNIPNPQPAWKHPVLLQENDCDDDTDGELEFFDGVTFCEVSFAKGLDGS